MPNDLNEGHIELLGLCFWPSFSSKSRYGYYLSLFIALFFYLAFVRSMRIFRPHTSGRP